MSSQTQIPGRALCYRVPRHGEVCHEPSRDSWIAIGVAPFLCAYLLLSGFIFRGAAAQAEGKAGAVSALLPRGVAERPSGVKELVLHDAIFWNDRIKTLENGRLRIRLENQSVLNVGVRSTLRVVRPEVETQQSRLELELGRIRARIPKPKRGAEGFEVFTGQAVSGVIGTHFYVRAGEKETTVISFQDRVRVRSRNPAVKGEEVLSSGELTTVVPDRPPAPKRFATPQELREAMEETLPARVARLEPFDSPAGSQPRVVLSAPGIEAWPSLAMESGHFEAEPGPCASPGYASARMKIKPDLPPDAYELTFETPEGPMMAALLVRPPAGTAPSIGQMVHAEKLPAGAAHRAVVVNEAARPMAGQRVRVRLGGKETVVETDANGAFEILAKKPGTVELFLEGTGCQSRLEVVKRSKFRKAASRFGPAGGSVDVPGVFTSARAGDRALAVATTELKKGQSFSTVMLPPDFEEGPGELTLADAAGQEQKRSVFVYRILGGRIDNPHLIAGESTRGEFVVCFGGALSTGRRLNATLSGIGFIRFKGERARGKMIRRSINVAGHGTARIPFEIEATKGAGPGVPFFINLALGE